MEPKQTMRIVVASPSDVQKERDLLPDILNELNHTIAADHNLHLDLWRWETDAYPGFHLEGPQGLIDSVLRIEDCDVLIGFFWKRFGTPTVYGQTGTEHEFQRAYKAWQERGRPQIMVYFNMKPYMPRSSAEADQLKAVVAFREKFPKEGLWWEYKGADKFGELVRRHLTRFIIDSKRLFIDKPPPRRDASFMVPPDLMQFTGRDKELHELKNRLLAGGGSSVVVCSVTGVGGVGKSQLAIHFAHVYRDCFPDGVFWARVDSETPMDAARNIATALHQEIGVLQNETHAHAVIQSLLSDKRALLVLDNADDEGAVKRVEYMRPSGTTVAMLVTTRNKDLSRALQDDPIDLASFSVEEGIAHFEKVLGKDPRLAKDQEDVRRIVQSFGGLPLMVDHVAQVLKQWRELPLAEYLSIPNFGNVDEKVNAVFAKSTKWLQPSERSAFIALGACVETGFSIETAMAVTGTRNRNVMWKLLYRLHDLSLLQGQAKSRFTLHPVVRAFARAQAGIAEADRRHVEHWCSYVKEHNRDSKDDWNDLTPEWDGICAAWDWCLEVVRQTSEQGGSLTQGNQDSYRWAAEIAANLRYFLDGRGHWQESIERMPDSLEAAKQIGDREPEFILRRHLAIMLRKTGNYDEAAQHNLTNIELASRIGRQDWKGMELEQLGRVRVRQERYAEAEQLYQEALDIARSRGREGKRYELQVLSCLGELHRRQRNVDQATYYFKQALQLYRESKDAQGVCSTLGHIGDTYSDIGNYQEATCYYSSAIAMFDRAGKIEVEGSLYQNLGFALQSLQRDVDALACYIVSADICVCLRISGWGGKSPVSARDYLLESLGSGADDFRMTSDNTAESVLNRARTRVQEIVRSIVSAHELFGGNDEG